MSSKRSTTEDASSEHAALHGGLDLSVLTQLYRRCLVDALERIVGLKTLVIDPSLAGVLGLITEVSALKGHGVDRMFYLEPGALTQAQRNIVYLCGNSIPLMGIIADQIKASDATKTTFTLLAVPRLGSLCTSALQDAGVYAALQIEAFPLEFVPLERDLLSLETPDAFKSIFLEGDYTPTFEMAKAIMTLQRAFGIIPRIVGKGDAAHRLATALIRLRKEIPEPSSVPTNDSQFAFTIGPIDSMVVLDRTIDLITPLATQLTYEGLIDETVGIKNAHVEVDPNLVNPPPNAMPSPSTALTAVPAMSKKKKILLSSTDALFYEIRDRNFATVGNILNRTARRINADYEARHAAMAGSVPQMRAFVGRLGGLQAEHQSLRLHTGLVDQIMQTTMSDEFNKALELQQNTIAGLDLTVQEEGIRDLINQEAPFKVVVRLACILCLVSNGFKPKVYDDLIRELLQTYGYAYLPMFIALADLRMLYKAAPSIKSPFVTCRKSLRLIVDDVDESNPEDIAYVYSGYAPLSVRLLQGALGRNGSFLGWKSIEDVIKIMPGRTVDVSQKVADDFRRDQLSSKDSGPVTLMCFLGGCTYTEIAAIRWINQQAKGGRKIIVLTTGIINGNAMLTQIFPHKPL